MTFRATHQEVLEAWRAGGQSTRGVADALGCSMATARERIAAALAHQARAAARARESNRAGGAAAARPVAPPLVAPRTDLPPHIALLAVRAHGGNLTNAAAELKVNRHALRNRVAQALRVPESAVTATLLGRLTPGITAPQERDDWRSHAACLSVDPELFFPVSETSTTQVAAARAVCATCPVIDACLAWALDTRQEHGVWGGTTPNDRRSLLRRAAAARRHDTDTPMTEEVA